VRDFYLPQAYTNSAAFQLPEHCRKLPMQDKAQRIFRPLRCSYHLVQAPSPLTQHVNASHRLQLAFLLKIG
jgi:hypothetical protein